MTVINIREHPEYAVFDTPAKYTTAAPEQGRRLLS